MEPQSNFPNPNIGGSVTPEQANTSVNIESTPNVLAAPEALVSSPEQARSAEQLAVDHAGGQPLPVAPVQQPVIQPQGITQPTNQTNTQKTTTPVSAGDGNLIEKEWIDKIKQVISVTADDPHAQQREVGRLAADYVLKRTGRKIGEDGG
jgi:hypothetical protein